MKVVNIYLLLENIPLVKFIKTTSGTWVVYFPQPHTWVYRWRNFGNFPPLFYQCHFVYIIKGTLHGGLKIWVLFSRGKNNILLAALVRKILFCHSKIKFISSRVISSVKKMVLFSIYTTIENLSTLNFVWKLSPSLPRLVVTKRKRKGVRG